MLHGLLVALAKILPPTIHPMVVHFPIALIYLTLLVELVMWAGPPDPTHFFARASFWLLTLSCIAMIGAMFAGLISEQTIKLTPQTAQLLSAHQHDAMLTGLFAGAAWLLRIAGRFPRSQRATAWSLMGSGRGRPSPLATVLVLGSVIFISITGSLGGSMVYNHGLGVHALPGNAATAVRSKG